MMEKRNISLCLPEYIIIASVALFLSACAFFLRDIRDEVKQVRVAVEKSMPKTEEKENQVGSLPFPRFSPFPLASRWAHSPWGYPWARGKFGTFSGEPE
jgi:hypothetical protein